MQLTAQSIPHTLGALKSLIPQLAGNQPEYMAHFLRAVDDFERSTNLHELPLFLHLKRYPVDVEEFLFSPHYLNRPRNEIYPEVLRELKRINNPQGYRLSNPYVEAVFTGGIGSAKTTCALYTLIYQLYVLSCFKNPHKTFGMDSTSEILIVFQSLSGGHAQSVDYARFRELCEQSTYFNTVFPFNKRNKKILKFPSRIEVKSIGTDTGAIGQNVIGGMIDEVNFMKKVVNSKRGDGNGEYDQAKTIYSGLARRRKTRFMDGGRMPGILCIVSSKRYPGEFTDKKIEEAKVDSSIYIYDKRVWDVKPKGTFNRGWFRVFVGDLTRKARILNTDEPISMEDVPLVVDIPEEFRQEFVDDIIGSLRDLAGVGTKARYPFILNAEACSSCFGTVDSIFSREETDFITEKIQIYTKKIVNPSYPRWVHIDLGVTNDSCGFAIGHCSGFKQIIRGEGKHAEVEMKPIIRFDGLLRIKPPKGDEIQFEKVRNILYILKDLGVNVKWVSLDTFQSVDTLQILKQKGFITGRQSVDVTNNPYEMAKAAFYDGRLDLPAHTRCLNEFLSLEKDNAGGKIDHPPAGSKDVSDAVAGVVQGLSNRREIWAMFNIPIIEHKQAK